MPDSNALHYNFLHRFAASQRVLVIGTVVAGTSLFGLDASANCAMPTTYEISVLANTVTICPINFQERGCPDPAGMLREGGGGVVKLADQCVDGRQPERCYVDECVPAGEYKYGFATPYECCETCCGTDYYVTATVAHEPPTGCVPGVNGGQGGESFYEGGVPWGESSSICDYGGGRGGGGGGGSGGGGSDDGSSSSSDDGCSCRLGSRFDSRKLVFAANGALVLLGFLISRRRRRG